MKPNEIAPYFRHVAAAKSISGHGLKPILARAADEIERLTAENERLAAPIGMQDVRLAAGEGKMSAAHTLQAVNVILKQRRDRMASQQLTQQKE